MKNNDAQEGSHSFADHMKTDKQRWKIVPLATVAYFAKTAGRVTFDPTPGTPGTLDEEDDHNPFVRLFDKSATQSRLELVVKKRLRIDG